VNNLTKTVKIILTTNVIIPNEYDYGALEMKHTLKSLNKWGEIYDSVTPNKTRYSAIAERPRCRVHYFWPKVEDWNSETIFYWHYTSVFNHC